MIEQNEDSFVLNIEESINRISLRERAQFSEDFMVFLGLLAKRKFEGANADAELFIALPRIEEASRRLLFQYNTEFRDDKPDESRFLAIQSTIENDLIHAFQFLQAFSNGRYHFSELQNAMRYLEPHKYTATKKTCGENMLDSGNRLRAFASRAWRVMNPLLSLAVTNTNFLNAVTLAFLYMAWIFPFMRLLLLAVGVISKQLVAPQGPVAQFSTYLRLKEQARRHRYLVLHDIVWFVGRLFGCFMYPHASVQVSFIIFIFGLVESGVLRKLAIAGDERKIAALSSVEGVDPLYAAFFQLTYKNGAKEARDSQDFRVKVMGFYVGSLSISLISLLFLSDAQPSRQFSWSWIGSLAGSFLVLMTCLFQTACSGNDRTLVPPGKIPEKTRGEDENKGLLGFNALH